MDRNDQKITLDERGIELASYSNTGIVRMLNNIIALSEDGVNYDLAITPQGIIARKIIGELLVGEKLIINTETGTVQINGDSLIVKTPENQIKVKLGKLDTGRYGISIYSNSGQVMLDERGLAQTQSFPAWDNVDKNSPMRIPIYIDESALSINNVKIWINLSGYRTFEKEASSGGGSTRTSTYNGNFSDTLTSYNEDWSNPAGFLPVLYTTEYPNGCIGMASFDHKHKMGINIGTHAHSLDLPAHTHPLTYAIYQGLTPESIYIKVDGTLVQNNITSNVSGLELSSYILGNGLHTIEIGSNGTTNNPNGLGRIDTNFYIKYFCGM
jgi:hypothetical protein